MLLHHLKHNKVLHENVILLSVMGQEIPQVDDGDRVRYRELGEGFCEVVANYGFMETPDVPSVLQSLMLRRMATGLSDGSRSWRPRSIWGGRRSSHRPAGGRAPAAGGAAPRRRSPRPVMARWRKKLFIFMARNAQSATAFFGLPPNRVVELGAQIQF